MDKNVFNIDKLQNLPMFDLPVDFLVYDNITSSLLNFYKAYPCKIEAFILAFCIKGEATATINLWKYNVRQNDFIVLTPGSFIQIFDVSEDAKFSFAGFSSKFLKNVNFWKSMSTVLMPIFQNPIIKMQPQLASIYGDALSLLTRASELEQTVISPKVIAGILNIFIDSISEAFSQNIAKMESSTSSREQDILSEFLQLAYENYRDEHKISFYAREVNLTLSHFCNVISRATGMTPQEIIMNLIIMDAKAQLKGTDATVAKIAFSLGFTTPTTFNRYFRTYTGMTPQEYRFS